MGKDHDAFDATLRDDAIVVPLTAWIPADSFATISMVQHAAYQDQQTAGRSARPVESTGRSHSFANARASVLARALLFDRS
jgi:hypothetical protein